MGNDNMWIPLQKLMKEDEEIKEKEEFELGIERVVK